MQNNNQQLIICPVCNGTGKNKRGFACQNCSGMGLGVFRYGKFYYWGPKLGRAVIELDHIRIKVHFFVNLVAYIFAFIGVIALGYWFYLVSASSFGLGDYSFWSQDHHLLFIFWLSTVADMFIVYQVSESARKTRRIFPCEYSEKNAMKKVPNNWEELKKINNKYRVEISHGFGQKTFKIIEEAFLITLKLQHKEVTAVHLFFSALADKEVMALFSRLNVSPKNIIAKMKNYLAKLEAGNNDKADLSTAVKESLIYSYLESIELEQKRVTPKNLLTSLIQKDEYIKELLLDSEVTGKKVYNVVLWFNINDRLVESYKIYKKKAHLKPKTSMNRAYTAVATPILDSFGYDLTLASKFGRLEFCVARDAELEKIFSSFESGRSGVILTGPVGVGKRTIVGGIAERMVKEDVPDFFNDKRLVEIDAARLISGATPTQAQGRLLALLYEVRSSGNIILFIDNVEHIVGVTSGEDGSLDLSEVLATSLDRGQITCIATSSNENYLKYIEKRSLGNIMKNIRVEEPVDDRAVQMIESKIGPFEAKYKVYFSYNALERVINLSKKYIYDRHLPEKAINILNSVAINVSNRKGVQSMVTKEDVAQAVAELTGIPLTKVSGSEGVELLQLEEKIHERMIGQEEAVNMVSASIRRARTELREGKRPIANFLFLGPTGVGKTELAKTISEVYFGGEDYMIRVDMSEYQHPDSVKKMIGDTQGIKGFLTEKVRLAPFSLILLDELEKAHKDILNLFLQVMDDGRLTDGQGRVIDFTNSIIIATSNAGAMYIQDSIFAGKDTEEIKRVLINEHLNKFMRPEFINRFDGVIVFEPLSLENVVAVAKLMLKGIAKTLDKKGIGFRVTEEGARVLANEGFDPKFGARPLRRVLQKRVENAIANKILAGELKRRDVVIVSEDGGVLIEKRREL